MYVKAPHPPKYSYLLFYSHSYYTSLWRKVFKKNFFVVFINIFEALQLETIKKTYMDMYN